MDENNVNLTATDGPTAQEVQPEQPQTPSGENKPEFKFTQDDLTRVGTKEAKKTEAALLKQFGLASKDDIPSLLERIQVADAAKAANETAEERYARLEAEKAYSDTRATSAESQLAELKQVMYLQGKNVPADEIDFYQFKITRLMAEKDIAFEEAAEEYIAQKPVAVKPPPFAVGQGKPINQSMTKEEFKKLGYKERLDMKNNQPTLYEELTGGK